MELSWCTERYEIDVPSGRTHTCQMTSDHDGMHLCPQCGTHWEQKP